MTLILELANMKLFNGSNLLQLLKPLSQRCMDLDVAKILQEVLVSGSYASAVRSLPSDALPLLDLLPLTTWNPNTTVEVKVHFSVKTEQLNCVIKFINIWIFGEPFRNTSTYSKSTYQFSC